MISAREGAEENCGIYLLTFQAQRCPVKHDPACQVKAQSFSQENFHSEHKTIRKNMVLVFY